MLTVLTLVVYVLVVARVTRLVTTDKITEPLRAKLIDRVGTQSLWAFGAHCPWCAGWWVAALLALPAAWVAGLPWWWALALPFAASQLVGMMARGDLN
ncbi:hypothetical protein [Nocardia farcinica]|uniref:hypothetical protein n=1 Tax=Nocardia farcinica TaxID=37329 RepID=UPI0024558856|nr:hypothetical protein [Nocardia farcinica]